MSWTRDSKPLGDHEFPEPDPNDDSYDVIVCPECGTEAFEDLDQCPTCLNDLSQATHAWAGRPMWWIVIGVVGVLATMLALIGR